MIHAIPNPKKSLSVSYNLDYTKLAIEHLVLFNNKYKLFKTDSILNKCIYDTTEFLSLGVYIDISSVFINENTTQITIEIRRKIGSFDQSHEVTLANNHISNIENLISQSLGMKEGDRIQKMKEITDEIENKEKEHQRKIEENKEKDRLEKENEPVLYYGKQFFLILATLGLIGGFLYMCYKLFL